MEIDTQNIEQKARGIASVKILTPVQAHRRRCLQCTGGSYKVIREYPETTCESWPYRLGKNPARAGVGGNPRFKEQTPLSDSKPPT